MQPHGAPPDPASRVRLEWRLASLRRDADGYLATFETPHGPQAVRARTVVSTLPAHALRGVIDEVLPGAAPLTEALREGIGRKGIYSPPVAAVTVGS